MSTRYKNGSHYENHQRAAELHDIAAHAHRAAEQRGKQDHLTGQEHSRQALEHSQRAHQQTQASAAGQARSTFGHDDVALVAYSLWEARGRPQGSPHEDWFHAAEELRDTHFRVVQPPLTDVSDRATWLVTGIAVRRTSDQASSATIVKPSQTI